MTDDDFLDRPTRTILDELGDNGTIVEWHAVRFLDGSPFDPQDATRETAYANRIVVVWPDETATRITTEDVPDPHPTSRLETS